MATTITREQEVAGHKVLEHSAPAQKLVYVDSQMVATPWDETVSLLERGEMPKIEDCTSAMHRVMACFLGIT
jgi:hypothetical protein